MAGALICAKCGQRIVSGNYYRYAGKIYCAACYDELMQELTALENAKVELYDYIKDLFGKSECPSEVVYAIDQALRNGKKIKGIQATLYYYYEVKGNDPNNIYLIQKVIREQYDNAREYMGNIQKTMKSNLLVDINVPPRVVKIQNPQTKKKIKYRMEDL